MHSKIKEDLIKKLNKDQLEAYKANNHCAVIAGPGSGKTATMTLKVLRLLEEEISEPRGIACITFNNEAVREFKQRLEKLKLVMRKNIFLGTVHSFCLQTVLIPFAKFVLPELPIYPIKVASEEEQERFLLEAMEEMHLQEDPHKQNIQVYRKERIGKTFTPNDLSKSYDSVISNYEKKLRDNGLIDFDDQIILSLEIINKSLLVRNTLESKFPWIMVDEYQDLGNPLHQLVLALKTNTSIKFFIIGDPDQSIYHFQGANPRYIQDIYSNSEFIKIKLQLNYRCGQKIIEKAENILDPNLPRNYKSARDPNEKGEIFIQKCPNGFDEQLNEICTKIIPATTAKGIKLNEIAILYIDRYDMEKIGQALDNHKIPYHGERDLKYPRTQITRWLEDLGKWSHNVIEEENPLRFDTLCRFWLRLKKDSGHIHDHKDELEARVQLLTSLKKQQFIGADLDKWLSHLERELDLTKVIGNSELNENEIKSLEILHENSIKVGTHGKLTFNNFIGHGNEHERVTVTTLHSSKGRQFDVVIIPGLETDRLPSFRATTQSQIQEARRLFFVGLTRARFSVYLLYSGFTINRYGRKFFKGPSPFVTELEKNLI